MTPSPKSKLPSTPTLAESKSELGQMKERLLGLWEIWDKNEREEREQVSEDNNVIVDIFLQFFFSLRFES